MEQPKQIAIYARVSTARQEEEQTIQTQLVTLREHAQKHNLTIIQEYTDEGWSGDTLARPALDKLRQEAKSKEWSSVLIYDPDRLARRYSFQELVLDELREAGIDVNFITVAAPKNSEDKILYGVRGIFAEYERAKITERFRLGKKRKAKEGNILISRPLYGYKYTPKTEKQPGYYTINNDEAAVVRLIFSLVANEGYSLRKVAKHLMHLGIAPQRGNRLTWHPNTIRQLLNHTGYIGEWHFGKRKFVAPENPRNIEKYRKVRKTSFKITPPSEWIQIEIPAIVERHLFNRAQRQLLKNKTFSPRNSSHEYLLKGLIWCGCGLRRYGYTYNAQFSYYTCSNKDRLFPAPRTCYSKRFNSKHLDQRVWQEVSALLTQPGLLRAQLSNCIERRRPQLALANERDIVVKEVNNLKEQHDRYNRAYGIGVLTLEQLSDYTDGLKKKQSELEAKLKDLESTIQENSHLLPENDIDTFCRLTKEALHGVSFEVKRMIIQDVIQKIVATDEKAQITGCIPVEKMTRHTIQRQLNPLNGGSESWGHQLCHNGKDNDDAIKNDIKGSIPFSLVIDMAKNPTGKLQLS